MARFSLDGGDEIEGQEDGSGPSNRRQPRKKQKLAATASAPEPPAPPPSSPIVVISPETNDISGAHEDAEIYDGEEESEQQVGANEVAAVDEEAINDRRLVLTLTDPDVLDCPICFENLQSPVFQCENGHIACGSCCPKISNKCPSCSFPIGYNRCRAIEKILEASRVSCNNTIYGCKHTMKYYNKHEHERLCSYSPCSCPMYNCDFINSVWSLYNHFESNHSATSFHFGCLFSASLVKHQTFLFLKEETLGTIFVLNQFIVRQGCAVSVVQIAPKSLTVKYRYELEIKDGETSIALKSSVECVPKLADYRSTKRFLVVDDFLSPIGHVKLDICISPHGLWLA